MTRRVAKFFQRFSDSPGSSFLANSSFSIHSSVTLNNIFVDSRCRVPNALACNAIRGDWFASHVQCVISIIYQCLVGLNEYLAVSTARGYSEQRRSVAGRGVMTSLSDVAEWAPCMHGTTKSVSHKQRPDCTCGVAIGYVRSRRRSSLLQLTIALQNVVEYTLHRKDETLFCSVQFSSA